jgi:hypothetical protein
MSEPGGTKTLMLLQTSSQQARRTAFRHTNHQATVRDETPPLQADND